MRLYVDKPPKLHKQTFAGFSGGAFTLLAPTYVSETAETKYRGALGSLMQFQVTFGLLVVYALGIEDAVNWEYITIMCLVVPGKDW